MGRCRACRRSDRPGERGPDAVHDRRSGGRGGRTPASGGRIGDGEALERTTDIVEEIHEMVTQPSTPWDSLLRLIDQLRVVARTALIEESRPKAVAPTADP